MRILAILIGALLLVLTLAVVLAPPARAHGDAAWINEGGYTDAGGVHCCTPGKDCNPIDAADVASAPGGYRVRGFFVPAAAVHSSRDAQHWACTKPGGIRCLFVPALF